MRRAVVAVVLLLCCAGKCGGSNPPEPGDRCSTAGARTTSQGVRLICERGEYGTASDRHLRWRLA